MDIYSFLNSSDIAEHCRNIGHTWTPFDMAVIIGISSRPMEERHTGWRDLVANYPDMPTPKNMHYESYPSLHEKIIEAITYEEAYHNNILDMLKSPEQGWVYTWEIKRASTVDFIDNSSSVFTTYEAAFEDIKNSYDENELDWIKITKSYLDDSERDNGRFKGRLNYDGSIRFVDAEIPKDLFSKWFQNDIHDAYLMFTDLFYVVIPTPFKAGDIVKFAPNQNNCLSGLETDMYVLEYIDYDSERNMERRKRYEGDSSDMLGWGYSVDEESVVERAELFRFS